MPLVPAQLAGARKAELTGFIEPCDPTAREQPPSGDDWLYEIKADGYRAQVHVGSRVAVYSRRGLDWTRQFGAIADAAARLRVQDAIFDGEAVVYGTTGRPDFQALRRELGAHRSERLRYHAFDLLALEGYDLREVPYMRRKQLLQQVLAGAPETLIYVEYLEAEGEQAFRNACELGLEGLVAKRRDSPYRSGRTDSWIKLKCVKSDTFPIVAFVEKLGAKPRRIASLYIGRREDDQLLYAGKAQTGYSLDDAIEVRERLDPFITKQSPLSVPINKPKATWVQPVVDAEIEYAGVTDDGLRRCRPIRARPCHPHAFGCAAHGREAGEVEASHGDRTTVCSGWSPWTRWSCTPGLRRWTTSSIPTGSSSTLIRARVLPGSSSSRPGHRACGSPALPRRPGVPCVAQQGARRGSTGEHPATPARCRRALEGGAGSLLAEGGRPSVTLSRPASAEAGPAYARHDGALEIKIAFINERPVCWRSAFGARRPGRHAAGHCDSQVLVAV